MARLVTSGFELQDASTTGSAASPDGLPNAGTMDTTIFRSGLASYKSPGGSVARVDFSFAGVVGRTYYARVLMYISAFPGLSFAPLLAFFNSQNVVVIGVDAAGKLTVRNNANSILGGGSSVLPAATFVRIEVAVNVGTGAIDTVQVRLNGVSEVSLTAQTLSDAAITDLLVGKPSATGQNVTGVDVYVDDVALNDDQGASQNSWPGEGAVVLLKPTADSAVGTGWTLGTGTAITGNSGKTAVANTPPLGVADLAVGSDPKQIRNAAAAANTNYDATLTTYTAAGVPTGATVNVVVPFVATASPVVTSAKAGTIGVVSNPAITNVALAAGGTAGTFWSGVAGGTFPTGWKWSTGTATYAPSVTLGTAPVARITQVTSSTRIAVVCALGMYVDYTPVIPAVKKAPHKNQVAVMRAVLR